MDLSLGCAGQPIRREPRITAVMRSCGDGVHGARARGLIVVLWRAGLRIQEALDLTELDLDRRRAPCSCGAAKVAAGVRSAWTTGAFSSSSHGSKRANRAGRPAVLRHQRMARLGGTCHAAPSRYPG